MKTKFICEKCGHIYEGEMPPKSCPICRGSSSNFRSIAIKDEMSSISERIDSISNEYNNRINSTRNDWNIQIKYREKELENQIGEMNEKYTKRLIIVDYIFLAIGIVFGIVEAKGEIDVGLRSSGLIGTIFVCAVMFFIVMGVAGVIGALIGYIYANVRKRKDTYNVRIKEREIEHLKINRMKDIQAIEEKRDLEIRKLKEKYSRDVDNAVSRIEKSEYGKKLIEIAYSFFEKSYERADKSQYRSRIEIKIEITVNFEELSFVSEQLTEGVSGIEERKLLMVRKPYADLCLRNLESTEEVNAVVIAICENMDKMIKDKSSPAVVEYTTNEQSGVIEIKKPNYKFEKPLVSF